jgi:hypothetical protein
MHFQKKRKYFLNILNLTSFAAIRAKTGHPTEFLKILHYALFGVSNSVRKYLIEKGIHPDT